MGKVLKQGVTIKGTKDGLLFFFDDIRPLSDILDELKYKLEHTGAQIWDGPEMKVRIRLGNRQISKAEEISIRKLFSVRRNLMIQGFETEGKNHLSEPFLGAEMLTGTIRSGQVLSHKGDVLLLGDVNPGGIIESTGSVYILGSLRGVAYAGIKGDDTAIIAASCLKPTQLRIVDIISRSPDHWPGSDVGMHFAYLKNNEIIVEKMNNLIRIKPEKEWKENLNL